MNRLEHAPAAALDRYHRIGHDPGAIEGPFVDLFLEAHAETPERIILDLDATDDSLHGHQEGRFFHGYYDCYCYLPLYVFCGGHLLAAKLRRANIDASAGAVEEIARIVARIRARWPSVEIVLRANPGFARDALMGWCEQNRVDYVFGLAGNARLAAEIEDAPAAAAAAAAQAASGQPARQFDDFTYATLDSWSASAASSPSRAAVGWFEPELHRHFAHHGAERRPDPLRGYLLRPRRDGEPDVWTPPALQAGFFFVQACVVGCCYVSGLVGLHARGPR